MTIAADGMAAFYIECPNRKRCDRRRVRKHTKDVAGKLQRAVDETRKEQQWRA